jgi:AGCS family alanine or glycine:cation symporter
MAQSNAAATALTHVFPTWNRIVIGTIAAIIIGLVIVGGIKAIGSFASKMIPFLAMIAITTSIIIVISTLFGHGATSIPYAFSLIFRGAFSARSLTGGVAGVAIMYAIRLGLQRGIASNEAGLGSSPITYATSKTDHPVKPAFWGCFEVFLDTHVMCTLIALVVLTQVPMVDIVPGFRTALLTAAPLITQAFQNSILGVQIGGLLMAFLIVMFGYTTVIGWSYVGEKCFEYLMGPKWGIKLRKFYRFMILPAVVFGAAGGIGLIWAITDVLNAFMALPNIIAAVLLSGITVKLLKGYFAGETYVPRKDSFGFDQLQVKEEEEG